MRRGDQKDFLPYPEILRNHRSYILQCWDGTLRETPGSSGTVRRLTSEWSAQLNQQIDIEYPGSRRIASELWIRVQFVRERCHQTVEGVPQPMTG